MHVLLTDYTYLFEKKTSTRFDFLCWQEFAKNLGVRAVAYLNLDVSMDGKKWNKVIMFCYMYAKY